MHVRTSNGAYTYQAGQGRSSQVVPRLGRRYKLFSICFGLVLFVRLKLLITQYYSIYKPIVLKSKKI